MKIALILGPLACLAAPSIWLLKTAPPLWRDVDAYVQLTAPPGVSTILLNGPLYCALARLPLWAGYLATATGRLVSFTEFMVHPQLTDAGVYTLVSVQHLALWSALLYLIAGLSNSLIGRCLLALFCASHSMFYAFAHCVGSETLSMIAILTLVGVGLRMVANYPAIKPLYWFSASMILFAAVLIRHINAVLASLLPITFILLAAVDWVRLRHRSRNGKDPSRLKLPRKSWVIVSASIALGVTALLAANVTVRLVCRTAHIAFRSEAGSTFVWRLNFLERLTPSKRHLLLEGIKERTNSPRSLQLLALLDGWFARHDQWDPGKFMVAARLAFVHPGMKAPGLRLDQALNNVALAFLRPPVAPLFSIVRDDWGKAFNFTEGDIARYLFATTEYDRDRLAAAPQLSALATFRGPADTCLKFRNAPYFRCWDFLSVRGWLIAWFGLACIVFLLSRQLPSARRKIRPYSCAVLCVGILMMLLNCFFARILPRFALPMMELLVLSFVLLIGCLLSQITSILLPSRRSEDQFWVGSGDPFCSDSSGKNRS